VTVKTLKMLQNISISNKIYPYLKSIVFSTKTVRDSFEQHLLILTIQNF